MLPPPGFFHLSSCKRDIDKNLKQTNRLAIHSIFTKKHLETDNSQLRSIEQFVSRIYWMEKDVSRYLYLNILKAKVKTLSCLTESCEIHTEENRKCRLPSSSRHIIRPLRKSPPGASEARVRMNTKGDLKKTLESLLLTWVF